MDGVTSIRKFVIAAFSEEELLIFCRDHFSEVVSQFSQGMSLELKAETLVTFCERRGQTSKLVEKLKLERSEKYKENPSLLELGTASPSPLEQVRAGESAIAEALSSQSETLNGDQLTKPDSMDNSIIKHPLDEEIPAIKNWFLNQIKPEEQVFVISAALFHGLEQDYLMDVYHDILDILKSETTTED